MGLGSTAKKIQTVADRAEELYARMNEMREQLKDLKLTVEDTGERVQGLDAKVDRQAVILEALAEEQGLDVDQLVADATIDEAEDSDGAETAADGDPDSTA